MSTLTNYWNEMTTGDKIQALLLFLAVVLIFIAWTDGQFISNTTIIKEVCNGVPQFETTGSNYTVIIPGFG